MLTTVAISIDEMHCTMTDIRSDIMVLTVDVSFMILEVKEPTLFSGLSNQANSLRSTAIKYKNTTLGHLQSVKCAYRVEEDNGWVGVRVKTGNFWCGQFRLTLNTFLSEVFFFWINYWCVKYDYKANFS